MSSLLRCSNHPLHRLSYQNVSIISIESPLPKDPGSKKLVASCALDPCDCGWMSPLLFWLKKNIWIFPLFSLNFLYLVTEVEPLEGTEKNSSCLTVRNHFGWHFVKGHSLLTGSDINIQDWNDSIQDISLLEIVKLTHEFFLSFFCTPFVKAWRVCSNKFLSSPR